MKWLTQVSLVLGLCLLSTGCAGVRKFAKSVDPNVPGGAALNKFGATEDRIDQQCNALKTEPSVAEEYALGGALAVQWVQMGHGLMLAGGGKGDLPELKLHRYLNLVGKNLAAQSPRPTLEWTFGVLDDGEHFNAVSTPGGYVFVTKRLLQGVENEAQLAGVLAHEIAHITLRHAIDQYNSVKVDSCAVALRAKTYGGAITDQLGLTAASLDHLTGAINSGGKLDLDGHTDLLGSFSEKTMKFMYEKGNSKEQEYAADELAVKLLLSAGYDPRAYVQFLQRLPTEGGVFSNHPKKADRVKRITAFLQQRSQPSGDAFQDAVVTDGLQQPPLPAAFTVVGGPSNVVKGVR